MPINIKTLTLDELLAARPKFYEEELQKQVKQKDRDIAERGQLIAETDKKLAETNAKIREVDERAEKAHRRSIVRELVACEFSGIPLKIAKSEAFLLEMTNCDNMPELREKLSEFEELFTRNPGVLNYSVSRYNGRH